MPMSSAMTIAGIGKTFATHGAPVTASTATNADSARPGRMRRSQTTEGDATGAGRVVIERLGMRREAAADASYGIRSAAAEVTNQQIRRHGDCSPREAS